MRALRFHAAHDVRVEEVPEPPAPGAGEVLVAPVACGICGTDLHEYTSGPLRTPAVPHPLTGATLPQILGHELAGTVIAVGPGVRSVAPEDRVSVMPLLTCGACRACRSGRAQHCELRACVGLRHPWGGMADRALVTEHQVARLPDAVSWTAAAMIEPLAVSASAVAAGGTAPGDAELITGAGPIGALAALAAADAGADDVVVSEPNAGRAALMASLGFEVLDPTSTDVAEACRERREGGFEVVVECSGHPAGLTTGLDAVAPGGCVV
jgi:(R,R)-butanediol dehydrogenase/meso-butanediol dehydrogenase/diacetyl reductase